MNSLWPIIVSSVAFGLAVALGTLPLFEGLLRLNRTFFADLTDEMNKLGMDTRRLPAYAALRWFLCLGIGFFFSVLLGMLPVGVFLGVLTYNLFGVWLLNRVTRYKTRIRDQLVLAARNFANQVRAGLGLAQAMKATSTSMPNPLGEILRRVNQQTEKGRPLRDVLLELKEHINMDGMTIFVIAILVTEDKGGNLPLVLDRLSYSLEEMQRVERKKDTDTAAGRLVVALLSAFPFCFVAFFYLLDPEGTGLIFTLLSGQIVLSIVGILVYLSVRWAQAILKKVD